MYPGAIFTFLHELVKEEPHVLAPAGFGERMVLLRDLLRRKQPLKRREGRVVGGAFYVITHSPIFKTILLLFLFTEAFISEWKQISRIIWSNLPGKNGDCDKVNDLLNVTQLATGRGSIKPRSVDLPPPPFFQTLIKHR